MHRHPIRAALAVVLATITSAYSATAPTPADEAAVVVTATRQPTRTRELLSDVTVIRRDEIEQAGNSTIGELLSRQPGLQVITTGGPGSATTVFMRGANAGHTLLLIDGLRFGSATAGQPSIESIPLSQIERIEILRGPAGAIYGADAIGGVIQIFTRRGEGAPHGDAFVGYGTYGTVDTAAGFSGRRDNLGFSVRAGHYQTRGFDALGAPPGADGFHQDHFSANASLKLDGGGEISGNAFQASGVNEYDGGGATHSRINKKAGVYGASWVQPVTADWTSIVRAGLTVDDAATIDPANASVIITRNDQFVWQNDIRLPVGKALLAYESLREGVTNTLSALAVDHRRSDALLAGWGGSFGAHRVQANARRDISSQYGAKNTGSFSYGYQITSDWRVHAAVGRAFKAPTFNDLYFPLLCFPPFGCFGGNAALRPEQARSREAGANWETGGHRASVVRFDNRITDLIVWGNQPFNVGNARLRGTTLSYDFTGAEWQSGASYTDQKARDADTGLPLIRRADRQANVHVSRSLGAWRVGAEWQGVERRDDTDFNTNLRVKLGGYGLVNAFVHHDLARDWTLEIRGNNLGDKKYQQALNFAVPAATLFVGLRYIPK